MKINNFLIKNSINLASPVLGSTVYKFSDQFFAPALRILHDSEPVFKDGVFDNHGKWMDGWETRRKRVPGNDFLIIKLGKPGKVNQILIDTSFFNGNQPEYASLEGCYTLNKSIEKSSWIKILNKKKLYPNKKHLFKSSTSKTFNFIRLNIFPDGGVARLRLMGDIDLSHEKLSTKQFDLASILNGSKIIACSDEHFGRAENLLSPGKSKNMGNGWETKRRRGPGFDWVIIKLGRPGNIASFEINTHYFKGNYPSFFTIQGASLSSRISVQKIISGSNNWDKVIANTKLHPNSSLIVKNKLNKSNLNLIKLNIFPDGGISRFRIYGRAIS